MKNVFTVVLATGSFLLSIFTLWLTQRRGRLKMTQPSLLCFTREMPSARPKVFLRALLLSTASKGCVIENMHLLIHQPAGTYVFDFWGYGEAEKLTLGSGLFVGMSGVSYNHHFNPRRESHDFLFHPGEYRAEVFASVLGRKQAEKLLEAVFVIDGDQAAQMTQILDSELYLFWNAETNGYEGHLERRSMR